ncbi:MAG: TraB/GumN family protein [Undibacterium sp.]|nr:TraB/GumN family protein [Opitutaceae bacterium]
MNAGAEEIIVTARRSGIPVWLVTSSTTTAILVGTIGGVTPGTRWDPASLDAALTKADRVMFPEAFGVSGGLFTMIGALGKWRNQASLPKGQTLQSMTSPAQWARLVALRDRGVLKSGFERKHPFHLAMMLRGVVKDRRKFSPGADAYARRFLRGNKGKRVPIAQGNAKEIMADFFGSAPRSHVACLMDTVARVEAGGTGIEARFNAAKTRSEAWATRRVPDALASKSEDGQRSCWPSGSRFDQAREASLSPTIARSLSTQQVTLAVVSLESLAEPGGVLDDLLAQGFDVRGPRWKR